MILWRNVKLISIIVISLSCFSRALGQYSHGLSLPKHRKSITIPFEIYNNLIVLKIRYNAFIDLNFILDTGVRSAILTDSKMALLMNPESVRPIKIGGLGGNRELEAFVATGLTFSISELTGKDQLLVILVEDVFSLSKLIGTEVHGLVGYEIFNRFVVEINYKNKFLKLHEPSQYNYKGRGEILPLSVEDTKPFITANISVKGEQAFPAKLIVDTGAGHALALYPGEHTKIQPPDTLIPALLGRGLSGDIFGGIGRIETLSVGRYKMENILTSFPDSIYIGESFISHQRFGNLGSEILSSFKVIFNYRKEYMVLEQQYRKEKIFYFNMSGINLISTGDDLKTYVVDHVRSNSPASKEDIRVGDVILEVNGKINTSIDLSYINALFHSLPGRKIKLKIKRGKDTLKKSIVLQKLI